jgi:ammonium transporter, Amt family
MKKRLRKCNIIKSILFPIFVTLLLFAILKSAEAGDPTDIITHHTEDLKGLKKSLNLAWILLCAFLVFNMQAGFTFLGAGFLQRKNTLNYLTMTYMDFCVGSFIYWAFGFALMFGGSFLASGLDKGNSFIGFSGFFLMGDAHDFYTLAIWLYQVMFACATCTIVAGAVAERFKLHAHLLYSVLLCGILYPIYGHWVWGGGWLANLPIGAGFKDFAGSGVVHGMGGMVALVGAWMVGPRFGKYNSDGTPNIIHGHNLSYVILGTLFLIFGWFGFNVGSTLSVTDFKVSVIAVNMFLAIITGAITLLYVSYIATGKSDIAMACNGSLAGCVAITASGAYIPPWAAVVIAIVAGFILRSCLYFVEFKLRLDDPIGAIAVHGANGLWGLIAVGIFADGSYLGVKGLITGSGWQLLAQLIGCVTLIVWTLGVGFLIFFLLDKTIGLRVPIKEEIAGIDAYEHGMSCYSSS